LPGLAEALTKNNYIHPVFPGSACLGRGSLSQATKAMSKQRLPYVRIVLNLQSLLTSVAPLS